MSVRFLSLMVILSALAGVPGRATAADPEPVAAAEEYDALLPPACERQGNRAGAECFEDSSAGVSVRLWSRNPKEAESTSRSTCLPRQTPRLAKAPPAQPLRYEVCNLHRSNLLYFQWVAAGFQSGSQETDLLRTNECACFDREVPKSRHDMRPFEANKPAQRFDLDTWQPEPDGFIANVFDLVQSLRIVGPDRSGQSRPKLRFWMRTSRDEGMKVVTELAYGSQTKIFIALPLIKPDAADRIVQQLGDQGFKGEVAILGREAALNQIAVNDRKSVQDALPKDVSSILVLTKSSETQASYNWQTPADVKMLAPLPIAIVDPLTGRLRTLIHYITTVQAR